MKPEHQQMSPQHAKRLEMSRAASDLLDRNRRGEIELSDRARELASFLFLHALDPEVREMVRELQDILMRQNRREDDPEVQRIMDAIDERVEAAAEELAEILNGPDQEPA